MGTRVAGRSGGYPGSRRLTFEYAQKREKWGDATGRSLVWQPARLSATQYASLRAGGQVRSAPPFSDFRNPCYYIDPEALMPWTP